tara:strand:+ start:204 stop:443 length:240 start_codon:yes stop_codon:yes gene_type:complete
MLNPLVDSLESFTITELENKVVELQRKYFMTHNPQVQAQIANILDIYREEAHTRRAIEYQRQKDQENGGKGLDSLINIS